jgi:hypothetical protein
MAGLDTLIVSLRDAGFPLILLWLLTLSIVYGILSHVEIPKSLSARGVIALSISFLVLFAAAAGPAAEFVSNLLISAVLIAFGLMVAVIFLELTGTKVGEKHVFAHHPKFFATIILILVILIFIGAGGLGLLNMPSIRVTEPVMAILFFMAVMAVAVWALMKESKK